MAFFRKIKDAGLRKSFTEVEAAFLEAQRVVSNAEEAVNRAYQMRRGHSGIGKIGEEANALDDALERATGKLDAAPKKLAAELFAIAKKVKIEYVIDWDRAEGRKRK